MNTLRFLPLFLLLIAPASQGQIPTSLSSHSQAESPALDGTATSIQTCSRGSVPRGSECIPLRAATDAEVRDYLIRASIRSYSGNCPCPYNADRAGRRCGGRSAYSRPGGSAPLCYPSDVSDAAVRRARGQS